MSWVGKWEKKKKKERKRRRRHKPQRAICSSMSSLIREALLSSHSPYLSEKKTSWYTLNPWKNVREEEEYDEEEEEEEDTKAWQTH